MALDLGSRSGTIIGSEEVPYQRVEYEDGTPDVVRIPCHAIGVDPGFSKDCQLPVDWNTYLELEADMIDDDWEHLSNGDLLDVQDADAVSSDADADDTADLASLPYGMRLP